mgnify:FL=1
MPTFANSTKLYETSQNYLAAGVSSNLRLAMKPVPIFVKEAEGSRMVDVDGQTYIDYILAYGPQILGHSHPVIVEAVTRQVQRGQTYGAQHEGEIELAELITRYVPCAERVSFSSTGSEAVQLALRLSRAYTGRQKIIRFDGHFHGWMDTISTAFTSGADKAKYDQPEVRPATAGQSENALRDLIVLPWNDLQALERVLAEEGDTIAGIITEPIMCNNGCIPPRPGYLERLRELATHYGIVLIFDEVITGFRLGLGGAQEKLNVIPDLVTLGKAVAGGLPLSVVGGKKEIMDLVATNQVFHMGTLNGNPLSVSAAIASINYLAQDNGQMYEQLAALTDRLTSGMRMLAEQYDLPLRIHQHGPVFHTMFAKVQVDQFYQFQQRDVSLFNQLAQRLLEEGIAVRPSGLWYVSTAHTAEDIDETLAKIEKCFRQLQAES